MPKWLQVSRVVLVAIALVAVAHQYSWTPYRCNMLKKRLEARLMDALPYRADRAAISARSSLAELQSCQASMPADADFFMIRGANEQLLNRYDDAVRTYASALRFHVRPEIYLNLGISQMRARQTRQGKENLLLAATFHPEIIRDLDDPLIRDEIAAAIQQRETRLRARKR